MVTVNIPLDKTTPGATVTMEYPNAGSISVVPNQSCDVAFRLYEWMGKDIKGKVNGESRGFEIRNNLAVFKNIRAGERVELEHPIETIEKKEIVRDEELAVFRRGCDVVDILPRSEHLRLYQRNAEAPAYYPKPEDVVFTGAANYGPTQQKSK